MSSKRGGGVLPSTGSVEDVSRISGETMVKLLENAQEFQGPNKLDHFLIIDCRYEYEYQGGHIHGAINLNKKASIEKFFLMNHSLSANRRVCLIFHCEFSHNRGPKTYRYFRSLDRLLNTANYPMLSFPEIYVLEGGYKNFVHTYPQYCTIGVEYASCQTEESLQQQVKSMSELVCYKYVSMWDERYIEQCRRETARFRKSWSQQGSKDPTPFRGHSRIAASATFAKYCHNLQNNNMQSHTS